MYWLLVALLAVVFSPMLFFLVPLGAVVLPFFAVINIVRATKGSPRRSLRLLAETMRVMGKQVFVYIPTIIPVGWFYITKSNSHHQGIRCHVPYEAYYVAWRRRRLATTLHPLDNGANNAVEVPSLALSPTGTPQKANPASHGLPDTPTTPLQIVETATSTTTVLQQATGVLFGFPPQTPLPYHPGNRSFSSPLGASSFGATSTTSFSSAVLHAVNVNAAMDATAPAPPPFPARGRLSLCTLDVYSAPPSSSTVSRSTSFASSSSGNSHSAGSGDGAGKGANSSFRSNRLAPVVVFLHGGSWSWGQKWHYATIAQQLRHSAGCCVVVPDYPKFPTGTIVDMVESVHAVLQWVKDHASFYGGDAARIHLVGHSAGAHLALLWGVRRAMALLGVSCNELVHPNGRGSSAQPTPPMPISLFACPQSTRANPKKLPNSIGRSGDNVSVDFTTGPQVASLMLFAGVFDLPAHQAQLELRCTDGVSALASAVDGLWRECSPTTLIEELSKWLQNSSLAGHAVAAHVDLFPVDVRFYHDPADEVVACRQSVDCRAALAACLTQLSAIRCSSGSIGASTVSMMTFPHGHDTIVLTSMKQQGSQRTAKESRAVAQRKLTVERPFIDEITRVVNS
jgi:dienelactone hydrolase